MTNFSQLDVVVAGGTGALGVAVVRKLASAGARCHVPVFHHAEIAASNLAALANVEIYAGVDLLDENDCAAFFDALPGLYASIHLVGGFAMAPLCEITLADFRKMMRLNAESCFLCCREAVRKLRQGSGPGRLVNVAARPALAPVAGMAAYSASKAAVANLTLALAEELASESIWVNAVVPGVLDTSANRAAMPDADVSLWAATADVAETIAFLASPQNRVTRGALVPVSGKG